MNDNKHFWERFARLYSPFMEKSNSKLYTQIAERIRSRLCPKMRVLELACGSGQLSFRLAGDAARWEATDFSPNMIAEAKKQPAPENLCFSVQDATCLPYGDGSFDAVVIANALHIMPQPDLAMKEIRRVLKPDGMLFAPTFVHGSGVGFMMRAGILQLAGFRVFSRWTAEEFAAYVERNGFTVEETGAMGSSIAPLCCLAAVRQSA